MPNEMSLRLGILVVCFAVLQGHGQTHLYHFEHYAAKGVLPALRVKKIVSDNQGILWLATDKGLCKFDQHTATFLVHDPENARSVADNDLSDLYRDSRGWLWMTTYTKGLSCYRPDLPAAEAFTNFSFFEERGNVIPIHALNSVIEDDAGNIWFGGQETDLLRMDGKTRTISRVKLTAESPVTVFNFFKDGEGMLWIGTRHHGFFKFDPQTGKASQFNRHPGTAPWEIENGGQVYLETGGMHWLNYYDSGFSRLDVRTGKWNMDLLALGRNTRFYDNNILCAAMRKDGTIWAGHDRNGLYVYDTHTGRHDRIGWASITPADTTSDAISAIYVDSVDNVWIGTKRKGLIRYSNYQNRFHTRYPVETSAKILQLIAADGYWWYLTETGLGKYNPERAVTEALLPLAGLWVSQVARINGQNYISTYDQGVWTLGEGQRPMPLPISGSTYGFREADCNAVLADTIGGVPHLWIGAWNAGLYLYNQLTHRLVRYDTTNGLPDRKVVNLAKDGKGNIWIGMDGYGLLRTTGKEPVSFQQYTHNPKDPNSIPSNYIRAFSKAADGQVWMLSGYQGVTEIHNTAGIAFANMPDRNPMVWQSRHHLKQDANGNFWIYTDDGTVLFDVKTRQHIQLLPGMGIMPAGEPEVTTFAPTDDGRIILATAGGFIVGNASDAIRRPALQPAVISKLQVNDEDYSHLLKAGDINLRDDQNFLTFSLAAPGYENIERVRFSYQLQGIDPTWRTTAYGRSDVSYTDVRGGDYTLVVRVGDELGNWADNIAQLPFRIQTPYWQSRWFYATIVGGIFLLTYAFFRYRLNQSRKINGMQLAFNSKLQEQLARQSEEIQRQLIMLEVEQKERLESQYRRRISESELKAIRAQMNPHFIFNVLNSIESYILDQNAKTASQLVQKFARLSRLVLENSTYSYVSVDREWTALKLYVELEAIRFNQEFDYVFSTGNDFDMKDILIPPMLVQPLVENAIHHGIRQNLGYRGKLEVMVRRMENSYVCFTIIDNGVGIKNGIVQRDNPYKKTSVGLATIRERISLIKQHGPESVAMLDLQDLGEQGRRGTKATLYIPIVASSTYPIIT